MPTAPTKPAPGPAYNPSEHVTLRGERTPLPGLAEALAAKADSPAPPSQTNAPSRPAPPVSPPAPSPAPTEQAKGTQTATATAPTASDDDKPAAHVKFVPSDEREEPAASDIQKPIEDALTGKEWESVPKALRARVEELRAERDTILEERNLTKKERDTFAAKMKDLETRASAAEMAAKRVPDLEKQLLATDEQLRISNYLQHPEFHEKYVKPVADAMANAQTMVRELQVTNEDGTVRLGTDDDFADVMAQPNHTLALDKAVERFGERLGPSVFDEAKRVKQAQQAQARAVKEAAAASQKWVQEQSQRASTQRAARIQEFDMATQQIGQKFSNIFLPPEGDKEAALAHAKGAELAAWIRDGAPEDAPQEVKLAGWAKIYHRVASWPLRDLLIQRLEAELADYKSKLASYEKSEPAAEGRGSSSGVTAAAKSPDDLLTGMKSKLEEYSRRR